MAHLDAFLHALHKLSGISEEPTHTVRSALTTLFLAVGPPPLLAHEVSAQSFYGRLNRKLMANASTFSALYMAAARRGVTFNYHAKNRIEWAIDSSDPGALRAALEEHCLQADLVDELVSFGGIDEAETRARLQQEVVRPSKLRRAHARDIARDMIDACAGCLVWSAWPADALRRFFSSSEGDAPILGDDFMAAVQDLYPALFRRARSLVIRRVHPASDHLGYLRQRSELTAWLGAEFNALDNHGHLVVLLDASGGQGRRAWELAADLTLFGERFLQERLEKAYFRPGTIQAETTAYLPDLDVASASFSLAFDGFTYRDLFVLHDDENQVTRLVLLFQKNRRDETLLPCPTCRSRRVQGNSYPTLGVRSWECQNVLCPDRSIYNRGKRFSFKALLMQRAITATDNEIPLASVRSWRRDVVRGRSDAAVIDMLVRHYSMAGDSIVLLDGLETPPDQLGRSFCTTAVQSLAAADTFWTSPFFHRYLPRTISKRDGLRGPSSGVDLGHRWTVLEGDAAEVLSAFPGNLFDRAVTSPPYFNARKYAQWPNLYCYLGDMFRIHTELFRVLKPGAAYVFNVFDYFDNERTIAFSAMGQKRLALSALFVDLFRRIGFQLAGNVVWDKGDVEGKRSFNAGNFSPFYQAPLNCWEHVFVFLKPSKRAAALPSCLNKVLAIKPVTKMVKGENRYGHSAPFPIELPLGVLDDLPNGALVLDPFGGSGTTARAALTAGLRAVMIERDPGYCRLSRQMIADHEDELARNARLVTLF